MTALLILTAALAAPTGVLAAKGGNSTNAKLCNKGGWETLSSTTGPFANQDECVSYAAQGGTFMITLTVEVTRSGAAFGDAFGYGEYGSGFLDPCDAVPGQPCSWVMPRGSAVSIDLGGQYVRGTPSLTCPGADASTFHIQDASHWAGSCSWVSLLVNTTVAVNVDGAV